MVRYNNSACGSERSSAGSSTGTAAPSLHIIEGDADADAHQGGGLAGLAGAVSTAGPQAVWITGLGQVMPTSSELMNGAVTHDGFVVPTDHAPDHAPNHDHAHNDTTRAYKSGKAKRGWRALSFM